MHKLNAKLSRKGGHGVSQKGGPEATASPNIHPWLYIHKLNLNWHPRIWHLFTSLWVVYLESSFRNVGNDLRIYLSK